MRINEVKNKTGLTKKAIDYYEERELIKADRSDNGYREYDEKHILRLKEIAMLRKLDFSINEINNNIDDEEKKSGEYIKNNLLRVFPKMLGDFMVVHFGRYLNEPIDTKEKEIAWLEIIDFLDNIEEFNIPMEFLEAFKDANDFNVISKVDEKTQQTMKSAIKGEHNATGDIKKNIEEYMNMRNKPELKETFDKMDEYKKALSKFYENSGYYSVFIPNMKIISKEYNDYCEGLIKLNEGLIKELKIEYDDNMSIVRIQENK
ncbi:MerR family transcriptional regulator [Oceanirhabdus seepicola]|uniref:MerR family transcriptional regulator n=1 Tax=Oceanirhabdus seepicola TaxID=2828781 RepID=A0A9J6P5S0_9CLOT|nr:MerR family transcriptional regulator [Oceanirhabdus seepicola]MCM1992162.1 MerR family transcriptional regulator [Oceanirhabdus seepicola]